MCIGPNELLMSRDRMLTPRTRRQKSLDASRHGGFYSGLRDRIAEMRIKQARERAEGNIIPRLPEAPIIRSPHRERRGAQALRSPVIARRQDAL